MEVLCFHPDYLQENSEDNYQYDRPVYCIEVGNELFDWFFNSKNGYRAAYFRSPSDGLKANQQFIESLIPELLASDKTTPIFDKKFIKKSLKSPSAKAWLVEDKAFRNREGKPCILCTEWTLPQISTPEIKNNRWEIETDQNVIWGSNAPDLTKIKIMGAFLNESYKEHVPPLKKVRAEQIHDKGWT